MIQAPWPSSAHHRPRSVVARLLIVVLGLVGACDLAGDAQGNPSGPSLALLGDSITVRATPSLHTALDPEYRVRLGAEVGMTFADMQETARTLGADGPAIVVVALGTNDVWNGVPTEESTAQLDLLLGNFPTACRVLVNVSDQVGVLEKPYDNGLASALNVVIADRADVVVD